MNETRIRAIPKGFSLLELVVVFALLGILFALAAVRYQSNIREAQVKIINFQANTFLRSIENVRAIASIQAAPTVDMGSGLLIYLNQAGWPIATNADGLKRQTEPSHSGCKSLWRGFFRQATRKNDNELKNSLGSYEIYLINGSICRYKLSRKQEGSYFFDYDVITGNVVITAQEL